MTNSARRDAPKFMLRFASEDMRQAIEDAAAEHHISMNTFLLQAVDEKLHRGRRIDKVLDIVERDLSPIIVNHTQVSK